MALLDTELAVNGGAFMLLSELFKKCAWEVKYENIGDDVSYAMIEENKVLFIYFQGSVGWKDWLLNFLFKKRVYKEFKVHRGFYHAYSQVRNIILDKVYIVGKAIGLYRKL